MNTIPVIPDELLPFLDKIDYEKCHEDLKVADMIRGGQLPPQVEVHLKKGGRRAQPAFFVVRDKVEPDRKQTYIWFSFKNDSVSFWQVADVIDERFTSHRGVTGRSLEDSILRVLEERGIS